MKELLAGFDAWCVLSAPIVLIAFGIRHRLNTKDLKAAAAGRPYARGYHVHEEGTLPDTRDWTDIEAVVVQILKKKHFRVVSGINSILAVSPLWAACPVFVSISGAGGATVSVFDRFLQPFMVGFVERRFRRCIRALIAEIVESVEQGREGGRG